MQMLRPNDVHRFQWKDEPPYFLVDVDLRTKDSERNSLIEDQFRIWMRNGDRDMPEGVGFDSESSAFVMFADDVSEASTAALLATIDFFNDFVGEVESR